MPHRTDIKAEEVLELLKKNTQTELALMFGCSISLIAKVACGERPNIPYKKKFRGICTCCGKNEKATNNYFLCAICFRYGDDIDFYKGHPNFQ